MILPDPGQEDIPIEIISKNPIPVSPYFRQLAAIMSVLVLTVGLGLAVKLSQENQNPFKKAGSASIDGVRLVVSNQDKVSYYADGSIKAENNKPLNLSALAYNNTAGPIWDNVDYQWGISSTGSIGQLEINSIDPKVVKFTPNGNSGRADIWVVVNGGVKASYAIVSGAFIGVPNTCGGTCGSHNNCQAGLFCFDGFCRNPQCKETANCSCVTQATTPTPTTKPIIKPTPEVAEYTPAPLTKPKTITEKKIYDLDLEKPIPTSAPKPQSFLGKIVGFILKLFGIKY